MPASGYEIRPRKVTNEQVVRVYHVDDAPNETDVVTWVGTLPSVVAGMQFANFDAEEIEDCENHDEYTVTVSWGSSTPAQPPAGSSSYRFSFQAPSGHIKRSLATISETEDPDILPFGASTFGAINVVDYGTADVHAEGFDLQAPAEVFTLTYTDVDAVIDAAYQAIVRDLCGKVNSSSFYGYAAGEIMLVRADGSATNGLWNLEFGFAYIANATNIPVGDNIVVPAKDGMDLLWSLEVTTKDDTKHVLQRQPADAFVERVWYRADLNDLNLP